MENKHEIINAAKRGNKEALQKLFSVYQSKVYSQCFKFLANKNDAEDMTQETFIKVIKNIDTLTDVNKFDSWILTIASNCCKSYMRKKKPVLIETDEIDNFFKKIEDKDAFSNPEQVVLDNEREKIIFDVLSTLPNAQKQTVYLYFFEDKSVKEIAQIFDVSEHCIRGRIRLGKKRVLKQLNTMSKLDSFAYVGAVIVFKDIATTSTIKGISSVAGSVFTKILAVTLSLAVAGLGFVGIRNLSLIPDENDKKDEEVVVQTATQGISYVLPDNELPFDVQIEFDVPANWEKTIDYDGDLTWSGGFKTVCSRYSKNGEKNLDFSYRIVHSYKKEIMKEAESYISIAEVMLNERNLGFEKINDNIAISIKEKTDCTRYFAVVKNNIPDNEHNAFSGYYYAYFAVDVYNDAYFGENDFLEILDSVDFNLIAHENSLWFERYCISRLAFDVTYEDIFIGNGRGEIPMKNTYSVYDDKTSEIVSLVCNMRVDTVVVDQAQARKDYADYYNSVTIGGYSYDRTFYQQEFVAEFFETGLVVIHSQLYGMDHYYISEDAKEIYKAVTKFKSEV